MTMGNACQVLETDDDIVFLLEAQPSQPVPDDAVLKAGDTVLELHRGDASDPLVFQVDADTTTLLATRGEVLVAEMRGDEAVWSYGVRVRRDASLTSSPVATD